MNTKINLKDKLSKFKDHWSPKIIARINDYEFKLVKIKGDFVWHSHKDTDEAFIVLDGSMSINLKDDIVNLSKGDMYVVPKGVQHKPFSKDECNIMIIEPKGVRNTGEKRGELTSENDIWI